MTASGREKINFAGGKALWVENPTSLLLEGRAFSSKTGLLFYFGTLTLQKSPRQSPLPFPPKTSHLESLTFPGLCESVVQLTPQTWILYD